MGKKLSDYFEEYIDDIKELAEKNDIAVFSGRIETKLDFTTVRIEQEWSPEEFITNLKRIGARWIKIKKTYLDEYSIDWLFDNIHYTYHIENHLESFTQKLLNEVRFQRQIRALLDDEQRESRTGEFLDKLIEEEKENDFSEEEINIIKNTVVENLFRELEVGRCTAYESVLSASGKKLLIKSIIDCAESRNMLRNTMTQREEVLREWFWAEYQLPLLAHQTEELMKRLGSKL